MGKLDFSSLDNESKNKYPDALQMNGIAYDAKENRIFVTGKKWQHLYQVEFTPQPPPLGGRAK